MLFQILIYTHSFNRLLIWADSAPSKGQRPRNKNSNTRYEKPSFELLARVVQKTLNIHSLLSLALAATQKSPYC